MLLFAFGSEESREDGFQPIEAVTKLSGISPKKQIRRAIRMIKDQWTWPETTGYEEEVSFGIELFTPSWFGPCAIEDYSILIDFAARPVLIEYGK